MSEREYTAVAAVPLTQLKTLPLWQLVAFMEASSPTTRRMILKALSA